MAHVDIIAEVAQGYEGDPSLARRFVGAAAAAGADLVKFQIVYADELATPSYVHHGLFSSLEMPDAAWRAVGDEAAARGIGLAFDVFGPRSLDVALACGAAAVKVHSTDFFNHGLVADALSRAPRVYFSVGGIEPDEVAAFVRRHEAHVARLTMMYGFQAEPTPVASNHLRRLQAWRTRFPGLALGFMDHADGAADEAGWLGLLALPLGVAAIEKHLTLDRALRLEDFVSALAPEAFARYVARVRAAEDALGSTSLDLPTPSAPIVTGR